jgi:hypothetical protein
MCKKKRKKSEKGGILLAALIFLSILHEKLFLSSKFAVLIDII